MVLQLLVVGGVANGAGTSAYGARVLSTAVLMQRVSLGAGPGATGTAGAAGKNGRRGADGYPGKPGKCMPARPD